MNFFTLVKQSISTRKIQFDIVTIFVTLIILFSVISTSFSYNKYRKDTLNLSKEFMEEVNNHFVVKISEFRKQIEFLAEATCGLITSEDVLSTDQAQLISYLLNVLKFNSLASSIEIETLNGNLLSAINLTRTFLHIPGPIPPQAKYAIRFTDRTSPVPSETWFFKDTDLVTIETKSIWPVVYDLRMNLWYENTINWPHIQWNNISDPILGDLGIVVSAPAIGESAKVIGAVAVRAPVDQLSNFFSQHQIGGVGRVFVLDQSGNLFIPKENAAGKSEPEIPYSLIASIYNRYLATHQNYAVLTDQNTIYLTNVIDFPVSFETHWYVINTIPQKSFVGPLIHTQVQTFVLAFVLLIIFGTIVYFSSKHISKPIVQLSEQVNRIKNFDFKDTPPLPSHIIEIITLDSSLAAMRVALRSFERYVPKEIVKTLLTQGKEIALGGEKKDLIIMFSDITDFTGYAETVSLEVLMPALSNYFDRLSRIILDLGGTIDKFMGDGIMAFWGAPQAVANPAYKACMAALQCHRASDQELKAEGIPNWHSRFGIHNGEVIVGNIGTAEHMNYSIIGDAVNTTSRLEKINKTYHTSIIISDSIKDKVWNQFITRPLDYLAVRGKKNRLMIHELIGTIEEGAPYSATQSQIELSRTFAEAYFTFHEGKVESAKKQFSNVLQNYPDDFPTQLYLQRIEQGTHPLS